MVICGDCGSYYGSKVWHSNDKYRKIIYRCNNKYNEGKCSTPAVDEERLKEIFVEAFNALMQNKDEIVKEVEEILEIKTVRNYDEAVRKAAVYLDKAESAYRDLIDRQKVSPIEFEEYEKALKNAGENYDAVKGEYDNLLEEQHNQAHSIYEIEQCLKELKAQDGVICEYDYLLMKQTVKQIRIYHDGRAVVEFMLGTEIEIEI